MNVYLYVKLVLGLGFLFLGVSYLYKPEIIYRINKVLRENLLNDSYIALSRVKIGVLFLLLAFIFLYMFFSKLLNPPQF